MINKIIKLPDFIKFDIIFTLIVFFLGILTFLEFETYAPIKYIILGIMVIFLYLYFTQGRLEFLIYPVFYLIFFASYNLYYSLNWPLWLVMIALIFSFSIPTYLFLSQLKTNYKFDNLNNYSKYFYLSLFNLIVLEIFLILIPWPTDPRSKGVILLIIFYLLQGTITAWLDKKFTFRELFTHLVIGFIAISAIIITTSWYAY